MSKKRLTLLLQIACVGLFVSWCHVPDSQAMHHLSVHAPGCSDHAIKMSLVAGTSSDWTVVHRRSTSFDRIRSRPLQDWTCAACASKLPPDSSSAELSRYEAPYLEFEGKRCSLHQRQLFPVLARRSSTRWFGENAPDNSPNLGVASQSEVVRDLDATPFAWYSNCIECEGAYAQFMSVALGWAEDQPFASSESQGVTRLASSNEIARLMQAFAHSNQHEEWVMRSAHRDSLNWDDAEGRLKSELGEVQFEFADQSRAGWSAVIDAAESRRAVQQLDQEDDEPLIEYFLYWIVMTADQQSDIAFGVIAESPSESTVLQTWRHDGQQWQAKGSQVLWLH